MKIDDTNSPSLKQLAQKQRNLIAAKENEIENVRKYYDQKKESERIAGLDDIVELKDTHQKDIAIATEVKSQRLQDINSTLQKEIQRLQSERELLGEQSKEIKQDALMRQREIRENTNVDNINYAKEVGQQTSEEIARIQRENQWQISQASRASGERMRSNELNHEDNLATQMQQQRLQLTTREIEHAQKLNELEANFKRDAAQLNSQNASNKNTRAEQFQKNEKMQQDHYENLLKQKKLAYDKKLVDQAKNYESLMENTKQRFEKQLGEIAKSYSKDKQQIETKAQDPFYQVQSLNPVVQDLGKHYTVSLSVPKHEADNVLLSARDRTIKMTMSRRYEERIDGDHGQVDFNKRSESYSQEFPVNDIVSSKNVTRKYEDGVLTFLINKA